MRRYDFLGPHEIITRHLRPRTRGRRTAPLNIDIVSTIHARSHRVWFISSAYWEVKSFNNLAAFVLTRTL